MAPIQGFTCCLCGNASIGWGENQQHGNNPGPLKDEGQCCDHCNATKIIPARIKKMREEQP